MTTLITNSNLYLGLLIAIVLGFLLIWWLIKTFASMRDREKRIYEQGMDPFSCPYDLKNCNHYNGMTGGIDIKCEDCERYNKGMSFNKRNNVCPFDLNYCAILGKSMIKGYVTKVCQNCPRYKNSK